MAPIESLPVSQKLYGREQDIATLKKAVAQTKEGQKKLIFVTGASGMGKTALIERTLNPPGWEGFFIFGRFDRFQRNTPYSALIQAIGDWVRQLLGTSDERLDLELKHLREISKGNQKLLTDLVPELEKLLGSPSPLLEISPEKAQNRFFVVFQKFLKILSNAKLPLVLFLKGVQWADWASLRLLQHLLDDCETTHLLVVGTYRSFDEIEASGMHTISHQHVPLSPLNLEEVSAFVTDTLKCFHPNARDLSEKIYDKTEGNPYWVHELLRELLQEGALVCHSETQQWQWHEKEGQTRGSQESIESWMSQKVQNQTEVACKAFQWASCLGEQFDLRVVAQLCECSKDDLLAVLQQALQERWIEQVVQGESNLYRFTHDHIRQAAHALISESQIAETHLKIGRCLRDTLSEDEQEKHLFALANHLNRGQHLMKEANEKEALIRLNLQAAKKSLHLAAPESGYRYLQVGLSLLEQDSWQKQKEITRALHEYAATAAYLIGDFEGMEPLMRAGMDHADSVLDRMRIYEIQIQADIAQNKSLDAIALARKALKELELPFPIAFQHIDMEQAFVDTKALLANRTIEALAGLPEMNDPYSLAAMRILSLVGNATYFTMPEVYPLTVFYRVNLSIHHGNSPLSSVAYAAYGLFLCGSPHELEMGYQFGQLALRVLDRFPNNEFKARTLFIVNFFIRPWKEPWVNAAEPILNAYECGLEAGDFASAAFSLQSYCLILHISGKDLAQVEQAMARHRGMIHQLSQKVSFFIHLPLWQATLNLIESETPCRLVGKTFDENKVLPVLLGTNNQTALFNVYFNKLILCFLFEEYEMALENANQAEIYLASVLATPVVPLFYFYDGLTRMALYPLKKEESMLLKVKQSLRKMEQWAHHMPVNFQHQYFLLEAEHARAIGERVLAATLYEKAIDSVRYNKSAREESLVYECAARFYLGQKEMKTAQTYLSEASYHYQRWGAHSKVRHLEQTYEKLLSRGTLNNWQTEQTDSMNLAMVLEASRSISEEIELDVLLSKVLGVIIENTRAQKGYLLFEKAGQWEIEAVVGVEHKGDDLRFPYTVISEVAQSNTPVVLEHAAHEGCFTTDPYIHHFQLKSVLCQPIHHAGQRVGLLYLENNLTTGAFTPDRLETLNLLASQAAISIEKAKIHASLQDREEEYRSLVENSNAGIFRVTVGEHGRLVQANPAVLRIMGYDSLEELSRVPLEKHYVNLEDRVALHKQLRAEGECKNQEIPLLKKNGKDIWISLSARFKYDENQEIRWIDGVFEDISERRRAEQVLHEYHKKLEQDVADRTQDLEMALLQVEAEHRRFKETQAQLVQSEKMVGLGTLVSGVAHEINNPVNFILGHAQRLEMRLRGFRNFIFDLAGEEADDDIKTSFDQRFEQLFFLTNGVSEGSHRVRSIVQDLRTFSRLEEAEQKQANLGEGLEAVIRLTQTQYQGVVEFICNFNNIPPIVCWPAELNQTFMNLTVNACQAIQKKQQDQEHSNPGRLTIQSEVKKNSTGRPILSIAFTDTGCGMDQGTQDRMFEPFFTTKAVGQGVGLGLSTAYGTLEKHEGQITVESRLGEGTTIILFIPCDLKILHPQPIKKNDENAIH